jgi:RimJ/RimL family protein N-acetyltransferase
MNNIKIEIANESDFESVKTIADKHNQTPDKYFIAIPPSMPNDLLESEKRIIFIAASDKRVIGYIDLHCRDSFKSENGEAEFEIVVDPAHRRCGAGEQLLKKAIQYITNNAALNVIIAKIKSGNIASERLCKKCGFIKEHQDNLGAFWELRIKR